ncbi:hypothetical protein BJ138DRAFT_492172 [Hygrophoropsis aurantiaca]|uniref:Uncharacterized protein n=1 Tax=Hygrophoropsis aurantiaca TaxID=72124 RepID=A0ACB8AMZ2_9AGAM|nr:hypothetical protein BJ138DRAFT_492172 [Hygrophoropsis aurantiaca]
MSGRRIIWHQLLVSCSHLSQAQPDLHAMESMLRSRKVVGCPVKLGLSAWPIHDYSKRDLNLVQVERMTLRGNRLSWEESATCFFLGYVSPEEEVWCRV